MSNYSYQTSEQNATEARKLRDYNDTLDLIDYLSQRDPFPQDHALRCIATGVLADEEVDVDECKKVGDKVLCSMVGRNAHDNSFRKKDQAVTFASKTAVRLS